MSEITTTSYAILGLLSIQPWSAYELKEFMTRSALRSMWPRAESSIYREPKTLVEHGLATVSRERHRGPERSVYAITPAGEDALREWLKSPHTSRRVEDEGLVHVLFSDRATRADLLAQIEAMREAALRAVAEAGVEEIARTGHRFPDRAHLGALVLRNGLEQTGALLRWCDWAHGEVSRWPENLQLSEDEIAELEHIYNPEWIQSYLKKITD